MRNYQDFDVRYSTGTIENWSVHTKGFGFRLRVHASCLAKNSETLLTIRTERLSSVLRGPFDQHADAVETMAREVKERVPDNVHDAVIAELIATLGETTGVKLCQK